MMTINVPSHRHPPIGQPRISLALALVLGWFSIAGSGTSVSAQEAGKVLFSKGEVTVVDTAGNQRPLRQGDTVSVGERILTSAGAMSQIRLQDGSLIGLRAASDLALEKFNPDVKTDSGDKGILALNKGSVRVINLKTPGGDAQPFPLLLRTPSTSIHLIDADNESVFVPPKAMDQKKDGAPKAGGTYTRLNAGVALSGSGGEKIPLEVRKVAYTPLGGAT
ncbi:MAG: hypothetical protein GY731_10220, partial [Gammaproteobacteria bacterium]|nr:hypothetical protein [Gammaproteobacteria bacterium]